MAKGAPPPSETLFVTGLPMDIDKEYTQEIFSQYGSVKEVTVLPVAAGKSAAAAFVIMHTVDDAKWIVDNVNGNVPQNLTDPVTVVFATPRDNRAGGKGGKDGKGKGMPGMMNMTINSWGGWGGKGGKGGPGTATSTTSSYKSFDNDSWDMGKGYGKAPAGVMNGKGAMGGMGGMGGGAMGKGAMGGKGFMGGKGPSGGKGGMMAVGGKNGYGSGGAANPGKFKTVMCMYFPKGACTRGVNCTYAHGQHELQR